MSWIWRRIPPHSSTQNGGYMPRHYQFPGDITTEVGDLELIFIVRPLHPLDSSGNVDSTWWHLHSYHNLVGEVGVQWKPTLTNRETWNLILTTHEMKLPKPIPTWSKLWHPIDPRWVQIRNWCLYSNLHATVAQVISRWVITWCPKCYPFEVTHGLLLHAPN